jgi:hypothetical membrane protein
MALAGIGAVCVGLFPETLGLPHYLSALTAFLFGGIAAIVSSRQVRMPIAPLFLLLGAVTLTALVLEIADLTLGLGHGGMERMIAYPIIIWEIAFAGYRQGMEKDLSDRSEMREHYFLTQTSLSRRRGSPPGTG